MGFSAKRLREFEREREGVWGRYFEFREKRVWGKNMNNHVLVKNMSFKNIMKIFFFILKKFILIILFYFF